MSASWFEPHCQNKFFKRGRRCLLHRPAQCSSPALYPRPYTTCVASDLWTACLKCVLHVLVTNWPKHTSEIHSQQVKREAIMSTWLWLYVYYTCNMNLKANLKAIFSSSLVNWAPQKSLHHFLFLVCGMIHCELLYRFATDSWHTGNIHTIPGNTFSH